MYVSQDPRWNENPHVRSDEPRGGAEIESVSTWSQCQRRPTTRLEQVAHKFGSSALGQRLKSGVASPSRALIMTSQFSIPSRRTNVLFLHGYLKAGVSPGRSLAARHRPWRLVGFGVGYIGGALTSELARVGQNGPRGLKQSTSCSAVRPVGF